METINLLMAAAGLLLWVFLLNKPLGLGKKKNSQPAIDCCTQFKHFQNEQDGVANNFEYCPFCGRSTKLSPALADAVGVIASIETDLRSQVIKQPALRSYIQQALDYHPRIIRAIERRANSPIRQELEKTAVDIDDWIVHVFNLALKLDQHTLEADTVTRDKSQAEQKLADLQQAKADSDDADVLQDIERNIDTVTNQLGSLSELGATMQRAQLRLDHTLSALGTIYSQTMVVGAKDIDGESAKQLQHEVREEIEQLDDIIASLAEVHAAN